MSLAYNSIIRLLQQRYTSGLHLIEEPKAWDLLTWGDDDWFGDDPSTTFFAYETTSEWSSIEKSDEVFRMKLRHFFWCSFSK